MKLLSLALLLVPVAATAQTQATTHSSQGAPTVGLYFNPIFDRVSNSTADTGVFAFLGSGQTSRVFGGVQLGGYVEFVKTPRYTVAADVRDQIMHGGNASLNNFIVSLRLAAQPMAYNLKPYVQVGGGSGRTASPLNTLHVTKGEFDVFAGIDKPLGRHVDWRPVEVGYGSLTTVSSENRGGGNTPIPAATLLHFSTGFTFRFP